MADDGSLLAIEIPGGVVKDEDATEYSSGPHYHDVKNVRFLAGGKPSKIGGWRSEVNYSFSGTPRAAINWITLEGHSAQVVASQCAVELVYDGALYDITPVGTELDPLTADPLTTTLGESEVEVAWAGHGSAVGDRVILSDATAVDGITLNGEFVITEIVDGNSFKVDSGVVASGSTAGGGGSSIVGQLLLPCGSSSAVLGLGYGVGPYGEGTYGTPRTMGASISLDGRYWSLDFWGEDLVLTVRNGLTYLWDASAGPGSRAAIIDEDAPTISRFSRVSPTDRHLICFGCNFDSEAQDPMLIRWCDRGNYGVWAPTATNDAGDKRLGVGTKIMGAIKTRDAFMVATDTAVYAMQFVGAPLTYAFKFISDATGIISQNGGVASGSSVYFVGINGMFVYNGNVIRLPCPIERFLFDNLNREAAETVFAGTNVKFDELWFFLPLFGATNPNYAVLLKPSTGEFSVFEMERVVWVDSFAQIKTPYALKADGTLYYHEVGSDDDNMPMEAYAKASHFELNLPDSPSGTALCLIRQIIPDHSTTGELKYTLKVKKEPLDPNPVTKGPFIATATTRKISVRARGRQVEVEYRSDDLGNAWKIGKPRLRIQPDGHR